MWLFPYREMYLTVVLSIEGTALTLVYMESGRYLLGKT